MADMKLGLVAVLALSIVAGCGGPAPNPGRTTSETPTVRPSATGLLAATPSLATSPSSTPDPFGSFVATGAMNRPRIFATATLLADGRVLIAGGTETHSDERPIYQSAELFDPSTRTFVETGSMIEPRYDAAAVRLADGRVMIAGGGGCANRSQCTTKYGQATSLKSVELYDPATGKFTPTGSMAETRDSPTALVLSNGKVLVFGHDSRLVEQYNPGSGRFTSLGSLRHNYYQPAAVLMPTGRMLVVDKGFVGYGHDFGGELFDPATGKSTDVVLQIPMSFGNLDSVTPLHDGRVLFRVFDGAVSWLVTYSPATGRFAAAGVIETPRGWRPADATLMADGRVLFTGAAYSDNYGDRAGVYDPVTGFHLIGSKMHQPRSDQTTVALQDGRVLVAGGDYLDANALGSAELFMPRG